MMPPAGLGAMFANWGGLACLTVLPAVRYVARIRMEEHKLEVSLRRAYAGYSRNCRRLIRASVAVPLRRGSLDEADGHGGSRHL